MIRAHWYSMQILGLDPIPMAILISVIAVGLRTWWGMSDKDIKEFNMREFSQTVIIGLLFAVIAVAGNIEVFPQDVSELQQLIFLISQISAIIGIDMAVKKGRKTIQNKLGKKRDEFFEDNENDFDSVDRPEEVPPGKDN